jgi:hypoxanthine phosphoribosyltransferase
MASSRGSSSDQAATDQSLTSGSSAGSSSATAGRVGALLLSKEQIAARVAELGAQISQDYAGRSPLLVGILKGAFVFMADLSRVIDAPVEFDFMAVSSYGNATKTSGVVRIVKDLDLDLTNRHVIIVEDLDHEIEGRDIIIVEDIVDSGLTLSYLRKNLLARRPASLEIAALLSRAEGAPLPLEVKYVGFEIPNQWVVGYGLDVAERYRELADIFVYDRG